MDHKRLIKRFGVVAIERGFISKDQFVNAMAMQIENDLEGIQPKQLGSILKDMGYMTLEQINDVLDVIEVTGT